MVKSRGKERDAPLRESSNTRPAEPSWERKQEVGREGGLAPQTLWLCPLIALLAHLKVGKGVWGVPLSG